MEAETQLGLARRALLAVLAAEVARRNDACERQHRAEARAAVARLRRADAWRSVAVGLICGLMPTACAATGGARVVGCLLCMAVLYLVVRTALSASRAARPWVGHTPRRPERAAH